MLFKKLEKQKVFRDVIHQYIHVDYEIILQLIDSKEVQRLRRIHQLGGTYMVYHNAEHSRFSHSLGVYEIVRRMINEVDSINLALSEYEKIVVMIAGLLHDVGHMPFSHSFESISDVSHEEFSIKIILDKNTEINKILTRENKRLAKDVAKVIEHKHPHKLLNQLISGQLDADRMDYLLRDAYFTGTSYGKFDLERVLRTIRVENDILVVKESGIHSIENYILARYHMYWQVYYHPVGCSFEKILESYFKRLKYLYNNNDELVSRFDKIIPFLEQRATVIDHYNLDENIMMFYVSESIDSKDSILSDLAERLINRKLFDSETITEKEEYEKIEKEFKKTEFDKEYYLLTDKNKQTTYQPYKRTTGYNIDILLHDGEIKELSHCSNIVEALVKGKIKEEIRVYFPKID